MRNSTDEDDEQQTPPPVGALPSAQEPIDWSGVYSHFRKNRSLYLVLSSIFLVILGLAVFFATRSLSTINTEPQQAPPLDTSVSPGAHAGVQPNTTPLPGAVPAGQGQPETASNTPPPPGVDPGEWQNFQQWRTGGSRSTQQQPQQTPAQQRTEALRVKMADLMWQARITKPDGRGGIQEVSEHPPAPPQPPQPQLQPQVQQPTPTPEDDPVLALNTCGPDKGSSYRLLAGISLIKARLLNAITGDARGPVIAQTVEPTYSFDLSHVLVPKGAYVTGHYERTQELDQERILLAVDMITMPDGCQIRFKPIDVLDQSGMAGLKDKVNHHYAQIFLTSFAAAAVGAGAQFGGGNGGYTYSPVDILRIGFGAGMSQTAQQMLARYGNRRTTLEVRAGQELTLFPPVDIPVAAWGDHHVHAPI